MIVLENKIIRKIADSYFVFFPSNGYFKTCADEKEAENTFNKGEPLKLVNIKQIPSMYTIHITNRCNLQCKYCFANSATANNIDMDKKTIKLIIKRLASLSIKRLCIDFHGGEPLLRFDLIEYALSICDQLLTDKEVVYTIQSNATLITDEMCRVFQQRNFVVGISLDGPLKIHDSNRVSSTGIGSFNKVIDKLELLKKYNIPYSIISVVTNPLDMYDIYQFFLQEKITKIKLIPVMPQGRAKKEMIDLEEYARIEAELFQKEIHSDKPILLMSSYVMLRKILFVDNSYMCMRNPCGAGINIMSFDEHGTIFPCDSMSGIAGIHELSFGSVHDDLLDIYETHTWKNITSHTTHTITPCKECKYQNICCGGCKSDVLNYYGDFNHPSPLCSYYQSILDYYYSILLQYPDKVIEYMKLFA